MHSWDHALIGTTALINTCAKASYARNSVNTLQIHRVDTNSLYLASKLRMNDLIPSLAQKENEVNLYSLLYTGHKILSKWRDWSLEATALWKPVLPGGHNCSHNFLSGEYFMWSKDRKRGQFGD